MTVRWPAAAAIVLLPALLLAGAKKEEDEAAAKFFATAKTVKLHIELGKAELESLRREPRKYVRCKLKEDGKVVGLDVGIHVKGAAGSTRGIDDKPGLTLNMDKFLAGQRYHGLDKWHLANSVQDGTYLHELITGEMFRLCGVPASRISHALVTINGRYRGLYYLKEGFDKGFLRRTFGSEDGNLYDGGFLRDIDQPLQLLSGNGPKMHADLKALAKACGIDKARRFAEMEKHLDMDRFISYLCVEMITCDWDGYPTNRNNYRIYGDPKTKKLVFIPSGMDQMFNDVNLTIFPGYQGMVARAVIETPEGRKKYIARLDEALKKHLKAEDLAKKLEAAVKPIQAALQDVDKNQARDLGSHAKHLGNVIKQRLASVDKQLRAVLAKKK
jgi:hypothetical protein